MLYPSAGALVCILVLTNAPSESLLSVRRMEGRVSSKKWSARKIESTYLVILFSILMQCATKRKYCARVLGQMRRRAAWGERLCWPLTYLDYTDQIDNFLKKKIRPFHNRYTVLDIADNVVQCSHTHTSVSNRDRRRKIKKIFLISWRRTKKHGYGAVGLNWT